jgi:homoserine kinase
MGSSAASAVAAAVAVNALLESPLAVHDLLLFALEGEKYASGGLHADNVAPSLLGGLVLCPEVLLPDVVSLPVPQGVSAALLHPDLQVNTAQARRGLAKGYPMKQWLAQQGLLAGFIAACAASNIDLIGKTLRDVIIEPQRKENVPCFDAVKEAAMRRGAWAAACLAVGRAFLRCARMVTREMLPVPWSKLAVRRALVVNRGSAR